MNRHNFIETFNHFFEKNDSKRFYFNILVKEYSNDVEFKENLYHKFFDFFSKIELKNKYSILEKVNLNKRHDCYYEEENPDSEFCSFECDINLHELYDVIKESENYPSRKMEIFRVESKDGNGLYSTGFASKKVNETHHPCPLDDKNFEGIFDKHTNDYKYQKEWYFAFEKLEDIQSWLINDYNKNELKEKGAIIKKFIIDENYIIKGNKQIIFKKDKVLRSYDVDWNNLETTKPKIMKKF